jgi:hypothetical protein
MSVNVMFSLIVTNIASEAQAKLVTESLYALVRDEDLQDEVGLGWVFDEGVYFVSGETDYPVRFSRFYLWRPIFESAVKGRVADIAPAAVVKLSWHYPDEDDVS